VVCGDRLCVEKEFPWLAADIVTITLRSTEISALRFAPMRAD
jgi:hypothetical protein